MRRSSIRKKTLRKRFHGVTRRRRGGGGRLILQKHPKQESEIPAWCLSFSRAGRDAIPRDELISFTLVSQSLRFRARRARKRSVPRASKKLRLGAYQREYRLAASGRSALPPTAAAFSSRIICRRRRRSTAAVIACITIR